jgi:hypothetical protein
MLDREYPDWAERVHLGSLDLWSEYDCVLGQLFPYWILGTSHFAAGVGCLIGGVTSSCDIRTRIRWARDVGFEGQRPTTNDYDMLTELWTAEVMKRRDMAVEA